jgi:hypothetical protein
MNDAARKIETIPARTEKSPLFREAPSNIEAEQALLGAILVNNDAFYRVSDFLKPEHFYEPLHRKIYEVGGDIDAHGQDRQPGDHQDLPARRRQGRRHDRGAVSRPSGRRSRDHHQCRGLWPRDLRPGASPLADLDRRGHGQHRFRRAARHAALDTRSRTQNGACSSSPRPVATMAASSRSTTRCDRHRHGEARPTSATAACRASPPASFARRPHGRPAAFRPDHARRTSGHGQDLARHQHRLQHCPGLFGRAAGRRLDEGQERRRRRLLLA